MSDPEKRTRFTADCPKCSEESTSNFSKSDLEEALNIGHLEYFCTLCRLPFKERLDTDLRKNIAKIIKDELS